MNVRGNADKSKLQLRIANDSPVAARRNVLWKQIVLNGGVNSPDETTNAFCTRFNDFVGFEFTADPF